MDARVLCDGAAPKSGCGRWVEVSAYGTPPYLGLISQALSI